MNVSMEGPPVEMMLSLKVSEILCSIDPKHSRNIQRDGEIAVRLEKALSGCVQSAVLWYRELSSTLERLISEKSL